MTCRFGLRCYLLCAALGLATGPAAVIAQEKKKDDKPPTAPTKPADTKPSEMKPPVKPGESESLRCVTADGIELIGDFYRPPEAVGKRAPCVILLHAVGPNKDSASRKDFGDLPKKLQKEGYAVLTFDFRGYGESKTVDAAKYARAHRLGAGSTVPRKMEARNFRTAQDLAYLVNDLIAIKVHLNKLNNEGLCNSHNIALIGIEQGATIGLMWVYNENVDENRIPDIRALRMGLAAKFEGEDVLGVVWISLNGMLSSRRMESRVVTKWLATLRDRTATLAFHGQNDKDCKAFWDQAIKIIKPERQKEAYELTDLKRLKNTNLAGHKLLDSAAFDVEKDILSFLNNVLVKPKILWQEHKGGNRDPSLADLRVIFG